MLALAYKVIKLALIQLLFHCLATSLPVVKSMVYFGLEIHSWRKSQENN